MMRIVYFLFWLIAGLISILPFRLLYVLSDLIYVAIYYITGYRRKVTYRNLRKAFPEMSKDEIRAIAKKFYKNLADLVVEVLKIRSISARAMDKRVVFKNYDIIERLYKEGKSIFVAIGHCGNWEWMGLRLAMISNHKPFAIVKPLTNEYFEGYMSQLRTKSGYNNLIKFKQTYRTLVRNRHQKNIVIIASDQTPTRDEINYWTRFMNQETPFFLGLEKMSKMLDMAVLFFDIVRVKRGHYEVNVKVITEQPKETAEYEITEKYVRQLEEAIRRKPDNWLWSHRRWKHAKERSTENEG